MRSSRTIILHAQWLSGEGLAVWARDERGYAVDPFELKTRLFSWHEASFYGTFLDIHNFGGWEGILLSPAMALDYFSFPTPLAHQDLQWNEEASSIRAIAPELRNILEEKSYYPHFKEWQEGKWGWVFPVSVESAPPFIQEWGEAWLQETNPSEWQALKEHPLLKISLDQREAWTEEEWQIAIGWKEDPAPFRPALQLLEPDQQDHWKLRVVLSNRQVAEQLYAYPDELPYVPPEWNEYLRRAEQAVQKMKELLPWEELDRSLTHQEAWFFLTEGSLRLVEAGVCVLLPSWWAHVEKRKPRLVANIQSTVGPSSVGLSQLMDFNWKLSIGNKSLSEEQFAEILKQKKQLIQVDGQWIQLDASMLEKLQNLVRRVEKKQGITLGEVLEAHFLQKEEEPDNELQVELNGSILSMLHQLQSIQSLPLLEPPASLQATLRPYQVEGFSWLMFLRRFGLGACLADDMGLGKTVQMISYLLAVKQNEPNSPPSLLICPTSVLGNWQKELKRFAPSLKVYAHYGSRRKKGEEFQQALAGVDVVLSTYTLTHLDQEELQSIEWNAIGLDEAQNIKNAYTKQAMATRQLNSHHRIAMTGTPIENRLTELWSIFDFINPGYLGSLREFTQRFVSPIEKEQNTSLIEQVQRMVRPFLLRRVKTDPAIELNLPDKLEMKEYLALTVEQASLYETVLQEMFEKLETATPMERRGMILASLTKLKQVCNHPSLFLKEERERAKDDRSPKVQRLLEMVDELRQEGDQCLIFTQYVEMGHLLQQSLEQELGERALFLHGGVPKEKRDEMIRRFQEADVVPEERASVFILSLKAGGTGLNLTAANHVFHIDRWWNPAIESQATDRAYRIGQSRRVQVHKFITLGTLEEKIDEMMERKKGLSEQIIGSGDQWITELSGEELKELLTLQRDWVTES
ncbi:DEAD/DEAH box helicase [Ammoniphilus sp. YIM 78166]|uniref:DEAD/DEAH box helicase n=1 Tax=Ammoniphilus sp. YIM 78166 TaxID=1644106 RepID=UPI0010701470|nr:DEAD/DEAH box helicase [Ammoniphilus sp. YIM 78166]